MTDLTELIKAMGISKTFIKAGTLTSEHYICKEVSNRSATWLGRCRSLSVSSCLPSAVSALVLAKRFDLGRL